MNMHQLLQQDTQIWDLFTRKEEYTNPERDHFDRFPYYACRDLNIFEPKASQYLVKHGYSCVYPDDAPFAVCLTHDIDGVYTSFRSKRQAALHNLKRGHPLQSFNSIAGMRSRKLPLCNFSSIMDLEEKYGARSTFFFLAEKPGEQAFTYSIEDLELEIGGIIDNGGEVGLHGGHTAYLDTREMKEKKERLEKVTHKPVTGYRNHYLRFRVPDTWECLSSAGFQYDSTLGYADCFGFRNGMCHPFRPFNLNTNHAIDIQEIPLTVMDRTMDQGYMGLDSRKWDAIKMLVDRIAACNGVFTVLWHNVYMEGENLKLYQKILRYCYDRKAWMTNGDGISRFFLDKTDTYLS